MVKDLVRLYQCLSLSILSTQLSQTNITQAGYREGITAGKEDALQEGFDNGFAEIGVPLGREVGVARGVASAMLSILSTRGKSMGMKMEMEVEARDILNQLNEVRFSDIAPRDMEAEEHAREHLEDEMDVNEELGKKRDMEMLEDMLSGLGREQKGRPTISTVRGLEERVEELVREIEK